MLAIRSGLIAAGVFVKYQLKSCASGDMTTGIYKNADTVTVHSATRLCILKMQAHELLHIIDYVQSHVDMGRLQLIIGATYDPFSAFVSNKFAESTRPASFIIRK